MKFKHSDKTLEIDGKAYNFKQEIQQVLQRGEVRVIVRLDGSQFAPDDPNAGRNIFSMDRRAMKSGELERRDLPIQPTTAAKFRFRGSTSTSARTAGR